MGLRRSVQHNNGEKTTSNEKGMYAVIFRSTLLKAIKLEDS